MKINPLKQSECLQNLTISWWRQEMYRTIDPYYFYINYEVPLGKRIVSREVFERARYSYHKRNWKNYFGYDFLKHIVGKE